MTTIPSQRQDVPVSPADLARAAGLTYRKLNYWTTSGYLETLTDPNPGSGIPRRYAAAEVEIARAMRRLIGAGVAVHAAAQLARKHRANGEPRSVRLASGAVLVLHPALWAA